MVDPFERELEQAKLEAAHEAEARLLKLAARLKVGIDSLVAIDPRRAGRLQNEFSTMLGAATRSDRNSAMGPPPQPTDVPRLQIVSKAPPQQLPARLNEIENEIMSIIAEEGGEVSLSALHERLQDIVPDIQKGTLSVRLHRMVTSGRLALPRRAHYALPSDSAKRVGAG